MRYLADAASRLEARKVRLFPLDAERVLGPMVGRTEIILTLPPGWRAELPRTVSVDGKWGRYATRYTQDAQTLHVMREFEGARGVYPPAAVGDLVSWLRGVAVDDVPYIVIESGASP